MRTQRHSQEPPPNSGAPAEPAGPASRGLVYQTPVVTFALIAVNVAMWLVTTALARQGWLIASDSASGMALAMLGGKLGPEIQSGQWWRLVTAMFLHAGLIHLAVNMWALLQLGTLCEILYGRARFLILYVCAGVLGNIASYEASPALGVGASGAIFGLLGVALVFGLKYRRELPGQMGDRLLRSLVPVLLLNLALTFAFPMIDKSAHLGGLLGGALLASLTETRMASAARQSREWLPVPAALASVVGLLLYGAWGLATALPTAKQYLQASLAVQRKDARGAIRLLERMVARHPDDMQARVQLMDLLLMEHREQEATRQFLELYRRLLSGKPADAQMANDVAYLYVDSGGTRLQEAEQLAQQAVRSEPDSGAILDTLAWIYYKEGKLKEAYITQQQAVGFTPAEPGSRYHMGAIEEAMGHIPAAREEYEMALRLDPKLPEARQALARLNGKPGNQGRPAVNDRPFPRQEP